MTHVRGWRSIALTVCVLLVLAPLASVAQQDPVSAQTPDADSESRAAAPGRATPAGTTSVPSEPVSEPLPGRAEYERIFAGWKYLLKDLRDIQHRFTISEEHELSRLRDEYRQKLSEGKRMVEDLRVAALRAYAENPLGDPDLTQFLLRMASDYVAQDRYEQAWEICETFMRFDPPHDSLYDIAGTAAFATQRFDLAEEYLQRAESLGQLSRGKEHLPQVAALKPLWEEEQRRRESETAADDLPRVRLTTNRGVIVLELFENEAPETVGNFIGLVQQGFYDGLTFHRVLPNFVAQGGCPLGDGSGGPGYEIYCEVDRPDHRNHFRGSLSMAKGPQPDTGGSQFFLAFRPIAHLNGVHTVFGRVIEGMEVLAELQRRDPDDAEQASIPPDRIITATVLRKRDHIYQPRRVDPRG